tara:strand:- start:336 stop:635 length:300 start_codon:yes stop_codon:yes gene_type:complete
MILYIFVRKGCCICDAVKNNLRKINIKNIESGLRIQEIDIDRFDLYQDKFRKYDYEVPVLVLKNNLTNQMYELPRLSPRLKDSQLQNWLKKNIFNYQNI